MKRKIFPIKYTSINIIKTEKNKITNKIIKNNILKKEDVKKNYVIIKVEYANLNYKDYLMFKGNGGLVKKFPHTPGIDASGIIYYSNSKKFKKSEKIFIVARPLGVNTKGSFSEYITVPDDWVEKLPNGLSTKEVMMIGTSGFTAVKAVNKSLSTILKYKKKPVLVTGATSNVGMFTILLLTNIGINIEVVTSKKENNIILKKMGVTKIHNIKNFVKTPNFPLLNEKYSVVFENLGGDIISICLKYLVKKGILLSIGNILGNISNINILPLILRGVELIGINAENSGTNERKKIFKTFKSKKLIQQLSKRTRVISLNEVSKIMKLKNYNKKTLRFVIKL
tara:strand:- start:3631 stop:4647 length:1017 start_codon:yes stop_codon:yes gene_type:complete